MDQISFTEKEIQSVADFVNMVYTKANFNFNSKEAMSYSKSLAEMHETIKKMEAHKFEINKVIEAKDGK